jgi:hypothetical protein
MRGMNIAIPFSPSQAERGEPSPQILDLTEVKLAYAVASCCSLLAALEARRLEITDSQSKCRKSNPGAKCEIPFPAEKPEILLT